MVKAPSLAEVNRYLSLEFGKSLRIGRDLAPGFRVTKAYGHKVRETDWVVVEFIHSPYMERIGDEEGLKVLARDRLLRYEEYLKDRYDVSRNDRDDPNDWDYLLVRFKSEGRGEEA